jgi:RNA polymerase sigma factor (sigma-70 family)
LITPIGGRVKVGGGGVSMVELLPDPADMPDEVLLVGLGAGDRRLTLAFIRRFQRRVFGVAQGIVGDPGLAEDVAQQAFERAWRRAVSYDPCRGTVRSWLITITHNLAVDTLRSHRPSPLDTHDLHSLFPPITDTPETHVLAEETSADLRWALAALPPEQARAAVLSAVHGMTAREIAELETIPLGTAKSRIRTALTTLHTTVTTATTSAPRRQGARGAGGVAYATGENASTAAT